ncbi:hypothetical protein MCOR27_008237 [Pyricularia oryzae]|uniref:Uncharacterized protein n=1 Tax=Pyricularia grisea TaxID=148305 RepID=A0ABQ8N7N2_PYRGI|nr:hypothetical protein MCOR01_000454 [Pyricularia oryzae]KAI6292589.1 hypothetical protein MCOR33_009735 [Pyricularia grisea]KAI6254353.1 hypothetical protein MCOR19_009136 [Pyricularia oryzae]KAI6265275.1 hypothetical protein MCOR26_010822 [Pyricularia oryzae]KAI6272673.1 hypothetical protein MCOR27_008237 [Pyricularia oryzae]
MEPESDYFANAPEGARDYVVRAPKSIQRWILRKVCDHTKEIERLEARHRMEIKTLKVELGEPSFSTSKRGQSIEVQLVEQQAMLEKLRTENERLKREMEEVKRGIKARYRRDEYQTNMEPALGPASAPVLSASRGESEHSSDTTGSTPQNVADPVDADMPDAAFSSPEAHSSTSISLNSPPQSPCNSANRLSNDIRT